MKQNVYARKKRQLKNLSQKLEQNWGQPEADSGVIQYLINRIKNLLQELAGVLRASELKGHLGKTVAAIIGVTYGGNAAAQSFDSPLQNPFGLNVGSNIYVAIPTFADLDNDGDQDLLVGEYYGRMQYYENTGGSATPMFSAPRQNPFGLVSTYYFALPQFVDLDNDGDMDLMVAEYPSGFQYFKNTGTASAPQFAAPQGNPFGLTASPDSVPNVMSFADLDNDGDMDLLASGYYGAMDYFENTGTAAAPQFAASRKNPFGLTSLYYYAFPAFVDLDQDGDMDLLAGEDYGAFQYFENTGTAQNPQFAAPQLNPFGLDSLQYLAFPAFADLDGDGDMDLLATDTYYSGVFQYFKNTSPIGLAEAQSNFSVAVFPNPVSDYLHIEAAGISLKEVEIINAAGAVVFSAQNPTERLDVAYLPKGAYAVKAKTAEGTEKSITFIKE